MFLLHTADLRIPIYTQYVVPNRKTENPKTNIKMKDNFNVSNTNYICSLVILAICSIKGDHSIWVYYHWLGLVHVAFLQYYQKYEIFLFCHCVFAYTAHLKYQSFSTSSHCFNLLISPKFLFVTSSKNLTPFFSSFLFRIIFDLQSIFDSFTITGLGSVSLLGILWMTCISLGGIFLPHNLFLAYLSRRLK